MTDQKLVFLRRLGSSAALWSASLWVIFSGYEPGFFVLLSVLALAGLREFYTMLEHHNLPTFKMLGMGCGCVLCFGSFFFLRQSGQQYAYDFEVAALMASLLIVFTRQMFEGLRETRPIQTMAYTVFGLLYVPWLFSFVTKIVYITPRDALGHTTGHFYVLFLVVVTKFSDMGAYLTGSVIGKHPFVPHISPKKTWEGVAGALFFSVAGGCALWMLMQKQLALFSLTHVIVLGLVLGMTAVVGDLAESIIKRSADAKDSGVLLPGIGGALDLIDSLLFTAPLMYFYMRFISGTSAHLP